MDEKNETVNTSSHLEVLPPDPPPEQPNVRNEMSKVPSVNAARRRSKKFKRPKSCSRCVVKWGFTCLFFLVVVLCIIFPLFGVFFFPEFQIFAYFTQILKIVEVIGIAATMVSLVVAFYSLREADRVTEENQKTAELVNSTLRKIDSNVESIMSAQRVVRSNMCPSTEADDTGSNKADDIQEVWQPPLPPELSDENTGNG